MAAAVDRDETAPSRPGAVTGDGATSARRGGGIVLVERSPERRDALGIEGEDLGAVETRGEAIAEGALHEADDTIRRVRALVIATGTGLICGSQLAPVPDGTVARANRAL